MGLPPDARCLARAAASVNTTALRRRRWLHALNRRPERGVRARCCRGSNPASCLHVPKSRLRKTEELKLALEQLDAKDWGFGAPGLARVDVLRQPGTWIARTKQGAILCDPRAAFMALRFNLRIAALQVDGFADASSQSATLQASPGSDATDELGALCQCLRWNVTIRQLELRRMCLAPDGAAVTALRALAQTCSQTHGRYMDALPPHTASRR